MRWLLAFAAAQVIFYGASAAPASPAPKPADPPLVSAKGQVLDPDGKPVSGARVVLREWPTIRRSDDPYQREVRDILAETKTDPGGRFQFAKVESRPFKGFRDRIPWDVIGFADGHAPAWAHLAKANDERELTLKLQPLKTIAGRLVDDEGKPIADCRVQVATVEAPGSRWHTDLADPDRLDLWSCELTPQARTDNDGRFTIAALPADKRLTLVAEHPDFARSNIYVATTPERQMPVEQTSISPDGKRNDSQQPVHMSGFTETLNRGGRVRGRVVFDDTGEPAPRAKVNATWKSRAHYEVADTEGRFEFTSLIDLQYNISTWSGDRNYLAARETVRFGDGQWQQEVELRVPRGEKVMGRVVDDKSGAGVADVGVAYVLVGADDQAWSPTKSVKTDSSGRFEISVPAGRGKLRIYGGVDRHATHDVPDHRRWQQKTALAPHHAAALDVAAGKPTDEVQLKVGRGLVVRGQVVDGNDRPLFAVEVSATDRFNRPGYDRRTVTDDEGRFELGGFPPQEELQLEILDATGGLRSAASIAADDTAGHERVADLGVIRLNATGTVAGMVLGDGKPLAGVAVSLQQETEPPKITGLPIRAGQSWWRESQRATTDAEGRYEFELVDTKKQFMISVDVPGYTPANGRMQTLKAGETLQMPPLELKSRAAFVAGVVVDPEGNPVPGVTVSASERTGGSIPYGRRGPPPLTDSQGRFRLEDLPNVPLELLAYISPPADTKDRRIHFPARVNVAPNQTNVRIVLDPKLQRPLP